MRAHFTVYLFFLSSSLPSRPPSEKECGSKICIDRSWGWGNRSLARCLSHCSGPSFSVLLLKQSWSPALHDHRGHWLPGAIREAVSHTMVWRMHMVKGYTWPNSYILISGQYYHFQHWEREEFHWVAVTNLELIGRAYTCVSLSLFAYLFV